MAWLWDHFTSDWVQAVGSILAIVVGFGAIVWQRWHEERSKRADQEREARALGVRILPLLALFAEDLIEQKGRGGLLRELLTPEAPSGIAELADRFHLLGQPGNRLLSVLGEMDRNAIIVERTVGNRSGIGEGEFAMTYKEETLGPSVARWHSEILTAIEEIQALTRAQS